MPTTGDPRMPKHEFEMYSPSSRRINGVSQDVGWSVTCKRCGLTETSPYDVLDTNNNVKFLEEQRQRTDCKGVMPCLVNG
jgi:hypothetical protein